MKKLSTYLFLFLFGFFVSSYADNIKDFGIDGIDIGDTLLDYISKEEILKEIEINKSVYSHLTGEFGEVYMSSNNLKNYEVISVFVKLNDKNYKIHGVRGMISYDNNIEECYAQKNKIVNGISSNYKNTKTIKADYVEKYLKEIQSRIIFFNSEFEIWVSCLEYEKSHKTKNNYIIKDGLSVFVLLKELKNWFHN